MSTFFTEDETILAATPRYAEVADHVKQLFGITPLTVAWEEETIVPGFVKVYAGIPNMLPRAKVVAIPCGKSTGLSAIVFTLSEKNTEFHQFLADNPSLKDTPVTLWHQAIVIWVKISTWVPPTQARADFYWINEGAIPIAGGNNEEVLAEEYLQRGNVLAVQKLLAINWPSETREEFLQQHIEAAFQGFFTTDHRLQVSLKVTPVAMFLKQNLALQYWVWRNQFMVNIFDEPRVISTQGLAEITQKWLDRQILQRQMTYPVGDPVGGVIAELKKLCAQYRHQAGEGFEDFCRSRIGQVSGANLTTKEVLAGYQSYCQEAEAMMQSPREFLKEFAKWVRQRYGICKSHDIRRPATDGQLKASYGFRHLALLTPKSVPFSEVSEVSEVPEPTERPEARSAGGPKAGSS